MLNSGSLYFLAQGLALTLALGITAILLTLLFGLILDVIQFIAPKSVLKTIDAVAATMRSVPELILLFIIYFGLLSGLKALTGHYVNCPPFLAGLITLVIIYTAFILPVFKGAKNAVSDTQQNAAVLLGLSKWQQYRYVIKPQSIKHAIPGCMNLAVCLLKDTALLSLIGAAGFMNRIQLEAVSSHHPFLYYGLACAVYLTISLTLEKFIKKAQYATWEH